VVERALAPANQALVLVSSITLVIASVVLT
jgi:hypothetical protein